MTFSTLASPGVSLQGGGGSGGGGGGTPGGSNSQIQYNNAGAFAGASGLTTDGTNLTLGSASQLLWSTDLILTRRAAANLRLGVADAAAPVAQTLSVQSVVAGTSNTAGANFTITGSQGTGTGAGGSIVFRVAPAGGAGTAQNALATALTINSATQAIFSGPIAFQDVNGTVMNSEGFAIATGRLGWRNGVGTSVDLVLTRDAANTLALRNAANAQAFRVYNTTDGTNSEFASLYWAGNTAYLLTAQAGTGSNRNMAIGTAGGSATLTFWTNGVERWRVDGSGHFIAVADNTYDIGAAGANRPRVVYAGVIAATSNLRFTASTKMAAPSDGVLNFTDSAGTDFGRLQFGGTTSSFPALKRSSTTLQARLADDSAFATIQGKLRADVNAVAETPTATHTITITDAAGTAYKVLCVAA